jgi:hypothetical protein
MSRDPKKNEFLQEKAKAILLVLDEPLVDLWALRSHAISEGGLVNGASLLSSVASTIYT